MGSAKEKEFLENLNEYIYDEDKIVTYKWLSCQLSIQVNYAKKLLEKYTEKYASNNLLIIFLIIGNKDGIIHVTIVPESELDSRQSEFNTIITKHIYSVQKKSVAATVNTLFSVDKTKNTYLGQIQNKDSIKKPTPQVVDIPVENINNTNKNTNKVNNNEKGKQKSPPDIAGMFAKKQAKNETINISKNNLTTTPNTSLNKTDKKGKNKNVSQKGIGNFFSARSTNVESNINVNSSIKSLESSDDKIDSQNLFPVDMSVTEEQIKDNLNETNISVNENCIENNEKDKSINNIVQKESKKDKKNNRKKNKSNGTTNGSNKRKRIRIFADSESSEDEIFGDNSPKSPKVHLLSDDEDVIPSTPQFTLTNRTKKKKRVDVTYLDNEEFMVTKKEFIIESESEAEVVEILKSDESIKKKNDNKEISNGKDTEKKNSAKKAKPTIMPKQTTLMTFFQKK